MYIPYYHVIITRIIVIEFDLSQTCNTHFFFFKVEHTVQKIWLKTQPSAAYSLLEYLEIQILL